MLAQTQQIGPSRITQTKPGEAVPAYGQTSGSGRVGQFPLLAKVFQPA